MKKRFHVVPHTRWNTEAAFTSGHSSIYLLQDFEEILTTLENNLQFSYFVLDGQACLLEDYLKWREQDKQRIANLIKDNTLIIGPWYTQSDQMIVSGESIVRNLWYGTKFCSQFNNYLNVAYVPNAFGQAASMPQIYQEFGIEDILFWRGVSDDDIQETEFIWQGEDESQVFAYQMPAGYNIGGELPSEIEALKNRIESEPIKTVIERASTEAVYLPNGFEQSPIQTDLPEVVQKLNTLYPQCTFEISSVQKYVNDVKNAKDHWSTLKGELLNGKLAPVHKSIFSSRADLKLMNTNIQHYLVNTMEPLLSIAYMLGFEYPHQTVDTIWKYMLLNATPYSAGACLPDEVNEYVHSRYKKASDLSCALTQLTMRNIATHIYNPNTQQISFTLFNTLDKPCNAMVYADVYVPSETFGLTRSDGTQVPYTLLGIKDETAFIKAQMLQLNADTAIDMPQTIYKAHIAIAALNLPSMGYLQLAVDLQGNNYTPMQIEETQTLENEHYTITLNQNGALDILDKHNGHLYQNQAILQESGDAGDAFNYAPPENDFVVTSVAYPPTVTVQKSDILQTMTLEYLLDIPKDLAERAEKKTSLSLPVTLTVHLKKGCPIIEFSVKIKNTGLSHKLCILFDSDIASNTSIADQQFGVLERPCYRQEEMEQYHSAPQNWQEMPVSIEPCQSFVSLANEERGLAILPKGVREYQIVGTNHHIIQLTLFRSYGFLHKKDSPYCNEPTFANVQTKTQKSQLLKTLTFDFCAYYYQTAFDESNVAQVAKLVNTPVQLYQNADFLNNKQTFVRPLVEDKTLSPAFSLLQNNGQMVLSTLKKAEEQKGLIIRYYNASLQKEESLALYLTPAYLNAVTQVNLKEEELSRLNLDEDTLNLRPTPHAKLVTLYLNKVLPEDE